jgi:uncharacterized Zn finger protein (UPF0148 family)
MIACIEDPVVIEKILTHLKEKSPISCGRPVTRKPGAATCPACNAQAGKQASSADLQNN